MSVWAHDEAHAAQTAHEWLDCSDKAGIDPQAMVRVERIGDEPCREDLLGTTEGLGPSYLALSATYARAFSGGYQRLVEKRLRWSWRSTAKRTSSSMSSGYARPDASHSFGYIEMGVNPGMVLTSLTRKPRPDSS
jgi:hypothetical protein